MKLGILIVLYNKYLGDSKEFLKLMEDNKDFNFLILDNSTSDFNNKAYCEQINVNYLSMNGNVGLSKAYNKGFEFFAKTDVDYVVLFDDDSTVSPDFFDSLKTEISNDNRKIYVPYIYDQNNNLKGPTGHSDVSTFKIIYRKIIPLTKELIKKFEEKNILAGINSGMAIPKHIVETYRYDERIFLDCVDWKFCDDMQKQGEIIAKFDGILYQEFHFAVKKYEITASKHQRLINRKSDLWFYSKRKYLFYLTYIIALDLKNSGNVRYLKYFFVKK